MLVCQLLSQSVRALAALRGTACVLVCLRAMQATRSSRCHAPPHAANARPSPPSPPSLAAPQDTWVDEADWRAVVLKALTESDVNKRLYKAGGAGRQ